MPRAVLTNRTPATTQGPELAAAPCTARTAVPPRDTSWYGQPVPIPRYCSTGMGCTLGGAGLGTGSGGGVDLTGHEPRDPSLVLLVDLNAS